MSEAGVTQLLPATEMSAQQAALNQQDYDLCQRVNLRDEAAMEEFVGIYGQQIAKLGRRVCDQLTSGIVTPDDMSQEAMLIFLQRATTYQPDIGPRFRSYATIQIFDHLKLKQRDQERVVHLPTDIDRLLESLEETDDRLAGAGQPAMSPADIADYTGYPMDALDSFKSVRVIRQARALTHDLGSIEAQTDEPENISAEEGETLDPTDSWRPVMGVEPAPVEAVAIARVTSDEIQKLLHELPAREGYVLRRYFGVGTEAQTIDAISTELGITRTRTTQLRDRALRRIHDIKPLRQAFAAYVAPLQR